MQGTFRFSFGPWNIHEGADPFGPEVRNTIPFNEKLAAYKKMGFDGVQFHDDDAVPNMANLTPGEIIKEAGELKKVLDDHVVRPRNHRRRIHQQLPQMPSVRP